MLTIVGVLFPESQSFVPESELRHRVIQHIPIAHLRRRAILQPMQQSAANAPASPPAAPDFAGLLAAFAEPQKKFPPARDTDGLADDIASLSYEQALRTHSRYRPLDADAGIPAQRAPLAAIAPTHTAAQAPLAFVKDAAPRAPARNAPPLAKQDLKRASITIRLSQSESAQLHQRASEAGLSISAYLRSCTFEVESLRTQVKETLALLRSATSDQSHEREAKPPRFWARLWTRLWPHARGRVA